MDPQGTRSQKNNSGNYIGERENLSRRTTEQPISTSWSLTFLTRPYTSPWQSSRRTEDTDKQVHRRIGLADGVERRFYSGPGSKSSVHRQLVPQPVGGSTWTHQEPLGRKKGVVEDAQVTSIRRIDRGGNDVLTSLTRLESMVEEDALDQDERYQFFLGDVLTLNPVNRGHSAKPDNGVTPGRHHSGRVVFPYHESKVHPRYVKNAVAEMDFEPRSQSSPIISADHRSTTRPPDSTGHTLKIRTADHWFLMPVQGWFAFSVILVAVVIVLSVICFLLYRSQLRQKRKLRHLSGGGNAVISGCIDPFHHELCSCRNPMGNFFRAGTFLGRASLMSRRSQRSIGPRTATLNFDHHQGSHHMPTRRKESPERDSGKMDSFATVDTQLDDVPPPPPLAPKMLIGQKSRQRRSEEDTPNIHKGNKDSKWRGRESERESESRFHKDFDTGKNRRSQTDPDIQLTPICPPPKRFNF